MKFKEFITEQKNTHMTHLEDKVIYGGVNGTRQAIMALRGMRDMLGGKHKGNVSVKWDGAPAIFCGQDPSDGVFFVAKKGVFNKNTKVYKSNADVDADIAAGDLNDKMKAALKYLPSLGIKGVIQGDFLFGPGDLKKKTIEGKEYVVFHPNTIVYAVPVEQAKELLSAKIGIVWHTTYKGSSFETMGASYGVDVKKLKKSTAVWSQNALRDVSNATMSEKDTEEVNKYLSEAGKLFNQIAGSTLRALEQNQELAGMIETFNNSFVRSGTIITDSTKHADNLIKYIHAKFQKEMDKRSTEKGKTAQADKRDALLAFFSPENKSSLIKMFELQRVMVLAKLKLINKLNDLKKIDTFVKTSNGYKVTGEEGYVAIDTLGGDAVKLVDRMEFSYNNFSPDIIKGWDKPNRN